MTIYQDMPTHESGRITVFHVIVVFLSLLLTISAWQFSNYQIETRKEQRFQVARDHTLAVIRDRMKKYEDALWSGVAAIDSHGGDISYNDWKSFARTLRIESKYPGINGIGVIHFHSADTLRDYLAAQQRDRPEFGIFPPHDQQILMPITYIEPSELNVAAVGLDIAHETNRRSAALASRDTGTAQITGPIVLVQDADQTPGFLFFAPYYNDDSSAATGVVYAPFVVHKLMEGLLDQDVRSLRFSISDAGQIIYDEHTVDDPTRDENPMFSEVIPFELYGRTWTIDLRTNLAFRSSNTYAQPTFVLFAGLIIEALIIFLLFMMSRANKRAVAYGNKITQALREESAALAKTNSELFYKNEELVQYAYVTSHDLKTPIRGISGLAEMIQEDLEDYLASPDANPEVVENLNRIQDRVSRMNQLTSGIIEFSQIGNEQQVDTPIDLHDVVANLRTDFNLSTDELRLTGNINRLHTDTLTLRRVLENLVGNAVKYHDNTKQLRITVCANTYQDRCKISVVDNGPGMDPKFHRRVFDVFQTLRSGDAPESTGIGLAIVKKAVQRHGGEINLVSDLGKGAAFTFDWPNEIPPTASEPSGLAA